MDFQLGGLVLPAPSLGCGCVIVPVAAAAADPAAAGPPHNNANGSSQPVAQSN